MKGCKKILGLVLVLCMLVPIVAIGEATVYDTEMVFTVAAEGINESVDYNADAVSEHFREKFNFKWDIISLATENANEKIRIWINSGDMPEIVINNSYNHGEYSSYVEQGLLYRFPDDWQERWPNAAESFNLSGLGPALTEAHGGTYIFPRALFAANKPTEVVVTHVAAYLRKDWAEAVGFELKDAYKTSELMEFARLVKEQDPGNVGNRLIPMSIRPNYGISTFTQANSAHAGDGTTLREFYKGEDGTFKWGPGEEETLIGLKLYRQAYDEGLLHPEFYTYTGAADNEDFYIAGISGVTVMAGMASYFQIVDNYVKENLGAEFDDVVHTAAILGEDGQFHGPELMNYYGVFMFSPKISQDKFERYMDLIDYAATNDAQMVVRMGIPGIDWDWGEDGEIISHYGPGENARAKYPSIYPLYHRLVITSDDFSLINPTFKKEYRERSVELYKLRYELGKDGGIGPIDWDVALFSSDSMNRLSFDFGVEYATLVMGDNDIETDWRNWVASNAYMVQPVIDELNAAFGD